MLAVMTIKARVAGGGRRVAVAVAVAVTGVLLAPGGARAAVTVVYQRGSAPVSTVYADGDRARIENPERAAGSTGVVIDAAAKKIVMLDDRAKTYVEITEEDMKQLRGKAAAMRTQMEERMKSLPPEQRKQMEALMARMGPAGAAQPGKTEPVVWKFEATGQKKTINGMACQMYKVNKDGKLHEEDCISPWSAGLLKKSDFEGLKKFADQVLGGLGMNAEARGHQVFEGLDQFPGVPISRVVLQADGTRGEEEQVKSITRAPIPASRFAIPSGYTKKDVASMMGARGAGGAP
jgi:hypothetical protein